MTDIEQKMWQAVSATSTSQLILLLTDEKIRERVMREYGFSSSILLVGSSTIEERQRAETFMAVVMAEIDRRCP